ncbi:MAG: hypothetical protein WCF19_01830 [Chlamydiales bacterium]
MRTIGSSNVFEKALARCEAALKSSPAPKALKLSSEKVQGQFANARMASSWQRDYTRVKTTAELLEMLEVLNNPRFRLTLSDWNRHGAVDAAICKAQGK